MKLRKKKVILLICVVLFASAILLFITHRPQEISRGKKLINLMEASDTVEEAPFSEKDIASIEKIADVEFTKGKLDKKHIFVEQEYRSVPKSNIAKIGNRIFMLQNDSAENYYLLTTENGKDSVLNNMADVVAKQKGDSDAKEKSTSKLSVLPDGKSVLIYGYYRSSCESNTLFCVRTKDGKNFYDFHSLASGYYRDARLLKACGNYVWFSGESDVRKNIFSNTFSEIFTLHVSEDLKKWKPYTISFSGKMHDDDERVYDDAINKGLSCMWMDCLFGDDTYLYLSGAFAPETAGDCEHFLLRTDHFQKYEKIRLSQRYGWEGFESYEQPFPIENGKQYWVTGIRYSDDTSDYFLRDELHLGLADTSESKVREIFSYKPGKYNTQTREYFLDVNRDGTNLSMFFEREKGASLLVSENGKSAFREYTTTIKASKCSYSCEDKVTGIRMIGYNDMHDLLLSKDGFINTYKIALPTGAYFFEINDSVLVVATSHGYSYIELAKLYKKIPF